MKLQHWVRFTALFQLVVMCVWLALIIPGGSHYGTLLNLILLGVAAALSVFSCSHARVQSWAVTLNSFEAAAWLLGLISSLRSSTGTSGPEGQLFVVVSSLAIILPCLANAILIQRLSSTKSSL